MATKWPRPLTLLLAVLPSDCQEINVLLVACKINEQLYAFGMSDHVIFSHRQRLQTQYPMA